MFSPRTRYLCALVVAALLAAAPIALAQPIAAPAAAPPATPADEGKAAAAGDGAAYPVSKILLRYNTENPALPNLADVMALEVSLDRTDKGYFESRADVTPVTFSLNDIGAHGPAILHPSAIRSLSAQVVHFLNEQGLYGVLVRPDPDDISPETGQDLRPEKRPAAEREVLRLVIFAGKVTQIRTVASGDRIPEAERVNNPAHAWIKEKSPIQPNAELGSGTTDLFRKDLLDDYLFELNRQPGRRVDSAIASAGAPGDVALDYLVTENKPWLAYYQLSNTGTKQTALWRDRFGFTDTQVTGHDDILTLDVVGTGFSNDDARALTGSYEFPIIVPDRLRLRFWGSWSRYVASDLGLSDENFVGRDWQVGGEVIGNMYQHKQWFLDGVAGARWHNVEVDNQVVDVTGRDNFFIPSAGLRLERITPVATTQASLNYEWDLPGIAETSTSQLPELGRMQTDSTWSAVKWSARESFFLDPLLLGAGEETALAHEIVIGFRGQWVPSNDRLVPQEEEVAGGLYSVRGYPEADAVGDTALIATLEYDYHLPRALPPKPSPSKVPLYGDFRFSPPRKSIAPDWDLIFRPFLDIGKTINNGRLPTEQNETLLGTGVGAELQLGRNLSIRCDWGVALKSTQDTSAGSSRLHFVLTLTF